MRFYQTIVILRPDFDDAQIEEQSEKVKGFIARFEGEIVRFDNWGKKRLAYRIRKNRFGIYLNICHKLDGKNVDPLENEFRLDENILKFLVIRLEADEFERICGQNSDLEETDKKHEDGDITRKRDAVNVADGDAKTEAKAEEVSEAKAKAEEVSEAKAEEAADEENKE